MPIYFPDGDSLFGCGGATNGGNYCNSQVETLIKQMLTASGSASQTAFDNYQVLWPTSFPSSGSPTARTRSRRYHPSSAG